MLYENTANPRKRAKLKMTTNETTELRNNRADAFTSGTNITPRGPMYLATRGRAGREMGTVGIFPTKAYKDWKLINLHAGRCCVCDSF